MSGPVKKGGYVSGYDEVVSGGTLISSGGYVFNVSQKSAMDHDGESADQTSDFDAFMQTYESSLDAAQQQQLTAKMNIVNAEISKREDADLGLVQETLKDVSKSWPRICQPLRTYIETNPAAIEPIKIMARRTLPD